MSVKTSGGSAYAVIRKANGSALKKRQAVGLRGHVRVKEGQGSYGTGGNLEAGFDVAFVARLAQKEKQIQQNYRPVIGVHKWFARRPGSLFRALYLSEYVPAQVLQNSYFKANDLAGRTIFDPFMGGGTPLFEANRLGMNVIGCDVNPMAYWIVHQELSSLNRSSFHSAAEAVIEDVEEVIGPLYRTSCNYCGSTAALVKYFLWVKQQTCSHCGSVFDLSPGSLIAENRRHPALARSENLQATRPWAKVWIFSRTVFPGFFLQPLGH